jgi:ATP-dependent DNA helicase RecG
MKRKETEQIEFKKSVGELKDALKSISAILNKHQKGVLYFGIKNNGDLVRNSISDKTLRDISQSISNKIEPRIYPQIKTEEIESIEVIKVMFEGNQIPYSAEGRYYIRVADEDKQMSQEQLRRYIVNHSDVRWDSLPNPVVTVNEIDKEKVKNFCKLADIEFTNLKDVLESNGLTSNGTLLNSAVILFGKKPEKYFASAKLSCALFATTKSQTILDQKEIKGDLLSLIREAENYILQNIHIGMEVEGLYRNDIPEINREALREAIINAFLHRDYFDPDFVSVNVFKDRVEIRNPGKIFGGLTIKDITTRNISRRRNEVIADVLSRAHFGERKGRGIALIKSKEPDAKFEQVGDLFITTLLRANYTVPKEVVDRLVEGLVENQQKIIYNIYENPKISKRELAEKLKISTTSVDKNVEKLKKMGILQRIGPAKGGEWKILMRED